MAAVASAPSLSVLSTVRTSHPYTCNTCQVAFKGGDLQRGHMQSDWHRYNLKRRVASLPPLTSEIFAGKVLANQASAAATAAKASFEKVCAACQRTYFSENAYENHLKSQKHKARLAQLSNGNHEAETEPEIASIVSSTFSLGDPITSVKPTQANVEDTIDEAEFGKVIDGIKDASLGEDGDILDRRPSRSRFSAEPTQQPAAPVSASSSNITPLSSLTPGSINVDSTLCCMFCNAASSDIGLNISHMTKSHGLFIPEQSYLIDLPGLLSYLHERVQVLHECLYCGHTKHTATGIQTHMRDKGHCKIAFETEEQMIEVGQFYDFRSTYSDEETDDDDSQDGDYNTRLKQVGLKLGTDRATTYTVMDEEGNGGDEDDWESDNSSEDDEEGNEVSTSNQSSRRSTRSLNQAYQVDYELHLPSGRTAGHRSLARYYRQNLHNYPSPAARQQKQQLIDSGEAKDNTEEVQNGSRGRSLTVSRANGGLGMLGAPQWVKKEARAIEKRAVDREKRGQSRYRRYIMARGNMQRHWRDPLLQ